MYVIESTTDGRHLGRAFDALPDRGSRVYLAEKFYFLANTIKQIASDTFVVGDSGYLTIWKWRQG